MFYLSPTSNYFSASYKLHGFTHNSVGKESTCNSEDTGLILGSGRSLGERIGYPSTPVFLGFPGVSDGKNLPAVWESWGQSLGWENFLE